MSREGPYVQKLVPELAQVQDANAHNFQDQIAHEKLRMVFARGAAATWSATAYAALMAAVLLPSIQPALVYSWLALKVVAALPRIVQQHIYNKQGRPYSIGWVNWLCALLFIDGITWGLAAVLLMPASDVQSIAFVSISLVGVSAIATFTLYPSLKVNASYSLPIWLITSASLLMHGTRFSVTAGLGLIAFASVLIFAGKRLASSIDEMLHLRFFTEQLAREREEAMQLAQRHSAVKTQFLATMSHEMRTPLHGILGLAKMLGDEIPVDLTRARLNAGLIVRSGEHLLRLINDILDFSRIESDHLQINRAAFDLTALVEDVAALSEVSASAKQLFLDRAIYLPTHCWVEGDALRVRQILHNLLGNAIKFTERGEVRLMVSRESNPEREEFVKFSVQDSGIGIKAEDLPTIFEAFHQVDSSFARRFAGTGLGLTISREISRAMGGDITCSSELGRGSIFELTIPLPPATPPSSFFAELTTQPAPLAAPKFHGQVLLVEDNDVAAYVAEAMLSRLGIEVETANDGSTAVERICSTNDLPDLVLMDCQMPGMDGFEATRRIRAYELQNGLPHIPIIALTANALFGDKERCIAAGMDDHLSKPFEDDKLLDVLGKYLTLEFVADNHET